MNDSVGSTAHAAIIGQQPIGLSVWRNKKGSPSHQWLYLDQRTSTPMSNVWYKHQDAVVTKDAMSTPTPNTGFQTRRTLVWGLSAAVAIGAAVAWNRLKPQGLPSSISSGNGRLEATDIDVATKSGGRIKAILVKEGDDVQQDQVVAIMDTATLDADLVRAQAQTRQAQQARHTVDALLVQRHQAVSTASALVAQRQAELALAQKQYQRTDELVIKGFLPPPKTG